MVDFQFICDIFRCIAMYLSGVLNFAWLPVISFAAYVGEENKK